MKKTIYYLLLFLAFYLYAAIAQAKTIINEQLLLTNNLPFCQNIEKDNNLEKKHPTKYYFILGICNINKIHDKNSFNYVVNLFEKSLDNNYLLAYFALATLYHEKYMSGSLFYGIKGEPTDILLAIKNYEKASEHGSAVAENNLGEIYLDYANLNKNNRVPENSKDVKDIDAVISLPDINKAVYWLTRAAKHGNPAAQGTLSDLYQQGLGVPQNYELAYVWQNLSAASQSRYNPRRSNTIGKKATQVDNKLRNWLYSMLTEKQKNDSQDILSEYTNKYFIEPSPFNIACQKIQSYIAGINVQKIFSIVYQKK